jgi:Alr-MurF fusion protein
MYAFKEIAEIVDGEFVSEVIGNVQRLVFDTRLVVEASGCLFFALKSGHKDGHRYVPAAYDKGIRFFVVRADFEVPEAYKDAGFIKVPDPLEALQKLGRYHRLKFQIPVLAITGSNGKTIVKEWLSQALSFSETITRSPRSYNSQIGVPLSIWQIDVKTTFGVFEAGISQPGEMERLRDMIQPTLGLFTNLGSAHQEQFPSMEMKLAEKLRLFRHVDLVFYGRDNELVHDQMTATYPQKEFLTWGRHPESDLNLIGEEGNGKKHLTMKWRGDLWHFDIPFGDAISVENIMPVILIMLFKGLSAQVIQQQISLLQSVAMRMEQKEGINGTLLINDSYNSDITSLETALSFLEQQGQKSGCLRTLILSDMFQTGLEEGVLYPHVAQLIRGKGIDRFIGVGEDLLSFAGHFRESDLFFKSTETLLEALPNLTFNNDAILIKGARTFRFERIVEKLELKQHSTVLEIDLDALANNLNVFRRRLNPGVKTLVMVKAFGYGSGLFEIASALQHHKVDYLGVAFADEGVELRQAGISLPIIVMNPEMKSFGQMLEYQLEPEIYSFPILEAWHRVVQKETSDSQPIHLKLDTGMYRLGFTDNEVSELIVCLKAKPQLRVQSVFSHLAGSDDARHDAFTYEQLNLFETSCQALREGLGYPFMRHILNSGGIERFPEYQFDMVRLGIGLYGISATGEPDLKNVSTLKTYVSQIKTVKPGATIGYGRRGTVRDGGQIAVLPIGYADGLNRHLSNGVGQMWVSNRLVPIVGNVCMDMCMIDVTDVDVAEGDEVIVFGDTHSIVALADQLDTIPYEILTSISRRVKRIYFKE